MDHTYVEAKSVKNLESYVIMLVSALISLKTLEDIEVQAINIGILPEDLMCRANTIIWDIRRTMSLYQIQVEAVLELLPEDFNASSIVDMLKKKEVTRAKQMAKKSKVKKCVT